MLCSPTKEKKKKTADDISAIVNNKDIQLALLNCSVELVSYAFSGEANFPELTIKLGRLTHSLDLFEACHHFQVTTQYLATKQVQPPISVGQHTPLQQAALLARHAQWVSPSRSGISASSLVSMSD